MATTVGQERQVGVDLEASGLAEDDVWRTLRKASFAVLGHTTPLGAPRSSGVVYRMLGHRLYVAVAPDSWKARHVAATGRVAVTVPVRRGGLMALLMPIPPATISFHATARVLAAGSPGLDRILDELGALLPADRRDAASVIEIVPEGAFVTYGVGIPLLKMRDPAVARNRVPIAPVA
jgi:hypothetical protein